MPNKEDFLFWLALSIYMIPGAVVCVGVVYFILINLNAIVAVMK